MFKFIVLSLLSVVGASFTTFSIASYFGLSLTVGMVVAAIVGLTLATGFIIPVAKTYLTGLALNGLAGGGSGGYTKVS